MSIIYKAMKKENEEEIISSFGSWVRDYNCLRFEEGCYVVAAYEDSKVIGFAAVQQGEFIAPLEHMSDAFIEVIEVDEAYRRKGIGTSLIHHLEEWAKQYGYDQIRGWSSDDKDEAISMWYALGYCMCPAAMLGESVISGYEHQQIPGYYIAKRL